MKARRSRISRLCRRLTRRSPDRTQQWKQISQTRSGFHPGTASSERRSSIRTVNYSRTRSSDSDEVSVSQWAMPLSTDQCAEPLENKNAPHRRDESAVVTAVSVTLFLLGGGFAAYAGYVLPTSGILACFGIIGAVGSILAAGIGVCMATSPLYRPASGRFAGLSIVSLTAMFGMLLLTTFM